MFSRISWFTNALAWKIEKYFKDWILFGTYAFWEWKNAHLMICNDFKSNYLPVSIWHVELELQSHLFMNSSLSNSDGQGESHSAAVNPLSQGSKESTKNIWIVKFSYK